MLQNAQLERLIDVKESGSLLFGGPNSRRGGPNPLANMDSRGSISARGFGLEGRNPGGFKSARTPEADLRET